MPSRNRTNCETHGDQKTNAHVVALVFMNELNGCKTANTCKLAIRHFHRGMIRHIIARDFAKTRRQKADLQNQTV